MHCKVIDCETNKMETLDPSITFHKMPFDPYFSKIWAKKCGRANETNRDNFYVCSAHFTNEDFDLDHYNRTKLKIIAIPSKKLPKEVDSDQNIYMSSLEALTDSDIKSNTSDANRSYANNVLELSTEKTDKNLLSKYKHLQLEFELLQDRVKEQEAILLALKKENSILNEYQM